MQNVTDDKKISPYTLLSRWFFDGSRTTLLPKEVIDSKVISQLYLLYYFQSSPYILYLSKHFNNYNIFQIPVEEILYFMKECILLTGYKPPFVQRIKNTKSEIVECLREKYSDLKKEDIHMLVKIIDESPEKDSVYEMFGIYRPKVKKLTKQEKDENKKLDEGSFKKTDPVSLQDLLGNFT